MKEKLLTIMFSLFCFAAVGQENQNNSTILGDTNGDGVINEEDISELEKNILGIHSDLFIKNNADVNHDEAINVADIVGLVNIYKDLNYRIYEFNYENERIKKIYLDNAGMLCSSATGEFGANDTIQFMSSNSSPLLLTTDDNGNLESIYIEDHLLHFYYDDNGDADIIEISKSDITIHQVTNLIDNRVQSTRGLAKQLYSKAFKGMKKFQDFLKTKEGKELIYKAQIELLSPLLEKYVYSDLTQLVDEINNNPDFHYLRLIRDGLIIVDDIASIAGLVGVTIASDGAALPISGPLLLFTLDGYNKHFEEFLNELIPDSDRMKKYADYYKKKYGINLSIFDPDNISPQKLTLHGGLLTQDGQNGENRKGNAYFYYWVMGNESRYKEEAKYKELSVGTYQLSLEIPVESGTDYFASVIYEIKIKGLNLKISSETITFKTPYELSPTIMDFKQTGSEYKKDAFTNNNKKYSYKFNCATTVDIEMLFDVEDWGYIYIDPDGGKKRISLMEFGTNYTDTRYAYYRNEPKSTVTFQPYVKYKVETEKVSSTRGTNEGDEDGYWYGEPQEFNLVYDQHTKAITSETTSIEETSATVKCYFEDFAAFDGLCGVEYWSDENHLQKTIEMSEDGEVEIELTDLLPNTYYQYRAFIKVGDEYFWAEETKSFQTPILPIITVSVSDISYTGAKLLANSNVKGVYSGFRVKKVGDENYSEYYAEMDDEGNFNISLDHPEICEHLSTGTEYQFYAFFVEGGEEKTSEIQIFATKHVCPDEKHPHEIDLGLGVKWACCNVEASKPYEYGGYYAWGEVNQRPINSYYDENYAYYNEVNGGSIYIGDEISSTKYDTAKSIWGDTWKMPTAQDFRELCESCPPMNADINGIYGNIFVSKYNGNAIFLPAAGSTVGNKWEGSHISGENNAGEYWSSTLWTEWEGWTDYACALYFAWAVNPSASIGAGGRFCALPIRAVKAK